MIKNKKIDILAIIFIIIAIVITVIFMNGEEVGIIAENRTLGYEDKIFDDSVVHEINIIIDNWDTFLATCTSEEYSLCDIEIDGELYKNVAIRGKGNTSLSSVAAYGNNRYSFKVEFDKYVDGYSYYGLDKLVLNNAIQDNTYIKDYLTYKMMRDTGVNAPLASFVNISVNGEEWGFYIALEGVEDAFLERNYGNDSGNLYKPDSLSMGGGRGNGQEFEINDFINTDSTNDSTETVNTNIAAQFSTNIAPQMNTNQRMGFGGMGMQSMGQTPPDMTQGSPFDPSSMTPPNMEEGVTFEMTTDGSFTPPEMGEAFSFDDSNFSMQRGGGFNSFGSSNADVMLQYIDDEIDSYSNIFDSAKTKITDKDKYRLIDSLEKVTNLEDLENTVDIEQVIKYLVVHNFVCNDDSYTGQMVHNYYLYEEDGQLSFIPWDYNLAFGGFSMGGMNGATSTINSPIDSPVSSGDISTRPMVAWIFSNEEYIELYHQYYAEFIEMYFSGDYFNNLIGEIKELISSYVEADPTAFITYDEFILGIDSLKEFVNLRALSVEGQLEGDIPSTTDGQRTNQGSLIDGSNIDLSALGSMNNTNNFGKGISIEGNTEFTFPTDENSDSTNTFRGGGRGMMMGVDSSSMEGMNFPTNGMSTPPDFARMDTSNMQRGMMPGETTSSNNNWLLIGITTGVLILGIIVLKFLFRRK